MSLFSFNLLYQNVFIVKTQRNSTVEEDIHPDHDVDALAMRQQKENMSNFDIIMLGSSIGNLMEWFDFAMHGLLANEIGSDYFYRFIRSISNY